MRCFAYSQRNMKVRVSDQTNLSWQERSSLCPGFLSCQGSLSFCQGFLYSLCQGFLSLCQGFLSSLSQGFLSSVLVFCPPSVRGFCPSVRGFCPPSVRGFCPLSWVSVLPLLSKASVPLSKFLSFCQGFLPSLCPGFLSFCQGFLPSLCQGFLFTIFVVKTDSCYEILVSWQCSWYHWFHWLLMPGGLVEKLTLSLPLQYMTSPVKCYLSVRHHGTSCSNWDSSCKTREKWN